MPDDDFIPDEVPEEAATEEAAEEETPSEPDPFEGTEEWGNGTLELAKHLFKGTLGDPDAIEARRVELVEWDTAVKDEMRRGAKQDVDE